MPTLSDQPVISGSSPGESSGSFSAWLRPHWSAMAGLARRSAGASDWEDVLQEALSSAWRKRHQFDADRGSARNWLLAIVADQSYKSRRRVHPVPVPVPSEAATAGSDAAAALDLDVAISHLTHRQQLAVNLRYFLGLSLADIALVMGCSEGTAKSTLSAARRRLREQLGEDYR